MALELEGPNGNLVLCYTIAETAELLVTGTKDVAYWCKHKLIDYLVRDGRAFPIASDVEWVRIEGEKHPDQPYDRILWRRFEWEEQQLRLRVQRKRHEETKSLLGLR